MDIGIGNAIALGAFFASAAPVCIVAIREKTRAVGNGNGSGASKPCLEHSGLCKDIGHIKEGQERQDRWLGEISKDVKKLLTERGGQDAEDDR